MMILWISLCECSLLYVLELKINEYFLRYLKVRRHIEIKKGQIRTIRWMPCKFLIGSSVKIAIIWHGAERRHGRTFWDCFVKCFSDMSSLIFSKRKNKYTLNILFFFSVTCTYTWITSALITPLSLGHLRIFNFDHSLSLEWSWSCHVSSSMTILWRIAS